MRIVLLSMLLAAAGLAHAQQGVYVPLPPNLAAKQNTMVSDIAKAYAQQAEADAADSGMIEVDPGQPPSVSEVSPGVLQFDLGRPAVSIPKPAAASAAPKIGSSLPKTAVSNAQLGTSSWRTNIYGGAAQGGGDPAMGITLPVNRAAAAAALPLTKVAASDPASNVGADKVAVQEATLKKTPAQVPARPLTGWPEVR